jgi:4-hydroxyphenylpyruvate dioxygenase
MASTSSKNPLGIKGIDHLEFCCESLSTATKNVMENFGFLHSEIDEKNDQVLLSQGQIRFLLNAKKDSYAQEYLKKHGEGVSSISFHVENCEKAIQEAQNRGAKIVKKIEKKEDAFGTYITGAIQGFGDVYNEFVERPNSNFRPGFTKIDPPKGSPLSTRVARIDHLTNNVPRGQLEQWVEFYERVYGFSVTRYFDIKGQKTGLESKVVQSHDGNIIIPINEPDKDNGQGQIEEFLERHNGPGVQHIALMTPNIISTVSELKSRGIKFLDIPHTYYQDIPNRDFNITEDINTLEKNQILVDGDPDGYLLQIFTDTYVGPLFFEIIQRKNNLGFGEGNFQALFDAIERDQVQRGYIK